MALTRCDAVAAAVSCHITVPVVSLVRYRCGQSLTRILRVLHLVSRYRLPTRSPLFLCLSSFPSGRVSLFSFNLILLDVFSTYSCSRSFHPLVPYLLMYSISLCLRYARTHLLVSNVTHPMQSCPRLFLCLCQFSLIFSPSLRHASL